MASTATLLKAFSAVPIINGLTLTVFGVNYGPANFGFKPLEKTANTVILDNQLQYMGCLGLGWGLALYWAATDLEQRQSLLVPLGISMFLGGLARVKSTMAQGWLEGAAAFFHVATVAELVAGIVLFRLGQ